MNPEKNIARLGRWALLAAPVLMAVSLFATVWSTYRSVDTASDTLVRGQADLLHDGLRAELRRMRADGTRGELHALLERFADHGLVYVAVLDGGRLIDQAGKPPEDRGSIEPGVAPTRGGEPIPAGNRVRMVVGGPPRDGARPAFVIEFEPHTAREVQSTARRTLALGVVGAGGFLVVALVLVRWLLRREAVQRRIEHEQRLASLGQMSAVLAHEIRNPLASLKGNAQLLARSLPDGEKPRAKAERVVAEAVRLETLVNDLLEFARAGELRRADVAPATLLRDVVGSLGDGEDRVDVDTEGAPATWRLDPERMRQVLSNLVENALQAGEGRVAARAEARSGRLAFVVRDRGPGIADDDREKIFEPFFTRRTQGNGLGLAVSRRLVELHGGAISAENAPDGGAVFTVLIPRS